MKELTPYLIIGILVMVIVVHLLERYAMVIAFGIIVSILLFIYFPPPSSNNEGTPVVNIPKPQKELNQKSISNKNTAIPKPKTLEFDPISKNYSNLNIDGYNCKIQSILFNKYLVVENFSIKKENAINRVKDLRNIGFKDAFFVYLPCYKTRIHDDRKLFAVIISQPFQSIESAKQEALYISLQAEEKGFSLSSNKILKLEMKELTFDSS